MNLRFKALELALERKPVPVNLVSTRISDYFGENVFDKETMRATLSSDIYDQLMQTIEKGNKIESWPETNEHSRSPL